MSEAGRRRPAPGRPVRAGAPATRRIGARTTASLALLALAGAVAVPAATATGDGSSERAVRGAAAGAVAAAPTDQIRAREWHLNALRAQKAWKYSRGRGVTVAVLDTGVDSRHPDLTGHVVDGPDLTGGVRRPGSRYWGLHGTSMASIISGHGHGPGLEQGMMGVAPLSRVLSVRVTLENDDPLRRDDGQQAGGDDRDAVAQGIRYAVDHGADIINMSLGGGRQAYDGTAAQAGAIKYALGKGVVLIASAGNDGSGANRKNFPAAYPGVIAVGALDRRLRLWKDSNRRSHAAVCAPGVDIVSADASNGYVVGTGTSASSAMVAGVAALVRSRYPKLTPAEVRRALVEGSPARAGRPTGSTSCRGTVDALRTLYAAHRINKTSSGPAEAPPPSPSPEPVARTSKKGSGVLLPLVLGGGGLLVVLGLVLGWRQRRRPEDEDVETDAVPDYGLPAAPAAASVPRESGAVTPPEAPGGEAPWAPADVPAPPRPDIAPVNVPLWQSTEVYHEPPAKDVPPEEPSPLQGTPLDGSWDVPSWVDEPAPELDEPSPPKETPLLRSELRPFVPGEFFTNGGHGHIPNGHDLTNGHNGHNGHNGRHANGANGSGTNGSGRNGSGTNGSGTNGSGLNGSGLNGFAKDDPVSDDDWEAYRRSALDRPEPAEGGLTAPLPAVPPDPPAEPPPPPVPPLDEQHPDGGDQADPLGQAGEEPRGRHSRRARPSDDEDYRPPWW